MESSRNILKGGYNSNKSRRVFVASGTNGGGGCPTVSIINLGSKIKFRDDYGDNVKTTKLFAKLIFK